MRIHYVNFRFSGWVEQVKVLYVGQHLRKGDLLFQIYAPSVFQAQDAYLRARDSMQRVYGAGAEDSKARVDQSMTKSREQLELLGLGTDFIDWLDKAGETRRYFPVISPVDGYVSLLDVYNGREVVQGENLLAITDLSRVWVEADLFEAESRYVKTGQPVRITLPYDPAFAAAGVVSYVYPSLSVETRTLKVRAELPNPALELRPGMFANLELEVTGGEGLVVPVASILDTGRRQMVFVEGPTGRFTPRVVTIGLRAESGAQVLSGLRAGERVVDRAAFLLDSESRIRAAFAGSAPAAH
jgi:multidrug efflux pump subunit AcrA (membrane-fusion protein)